MLTLSTNFGGDWHGVRLAFGLATLNLRRCLKTLAAIFAERVNSKQPLAISF